MAFLLPEGRRSLSAYAYHIGPSHTYQPAYRFIAADIAIEHGAWLDLGTGTGWLAIHAGAGKPDLDVIGIDTSETMLQLADTNKGGRLNVTFRKMEASDVIYPAGTFTVVTAVQLFHHLQDRAKVLSEAHRVLVPGGKLYIYEADPDVDVPGDWVSRRGIWPPDGVLKKRWKTYGMDQAAWDQLKRDVESSPFGTSYTDERHGFYRRLVCTH
jgi:ubiquinone/menaquinone biosynthesis C-methylase UbiE